MPQRRLQNVLTDCTKTLRDCRDFAADAYRWSLPGSKPRISSKRCDSITEVAFLRAYLALEAFLEESFILYLIGQKPPRGRRPYRFTIPPNRKAADEWVVPEGKRYADWHAVQVIKRAQRFFRSGGHFAGPLMGSQASLDEAQRIRNAVAHESTNATLKFEGLVREKLGTLPPNLTIGGFLGMTVPASSPPTTFLEFYLDRFELVVTQIVPS